MKALIPLLLILSFTGCEPDSGTDTTPQDSTDTTPQDSTDTTPQDSTDTTPQDSTDTTPQDSTDTTPQDSTDTTPQDSTDTTPQDSTDSVPCTNALECPPSAQLITPIEISKKYDVEAKIPRSGYVIGDSIAWQELLSKIGSHNVIETEVDFDRFTVIAVFAGSITTVATLDIIRICEQEDSITVVSTVFRSAAQAISYPFEIVKIPRTSKQIVFQSGRVPIDIPITPPDSCENGGYVFKPTEKNIYYYYNGEKINLTLALDTACSEQNNIPCFKRFDIYGGPSRISDVFYIQLKDQGDTTRLKEVVAQKNVTIVKHSELSPLWYILEIDGCSLKSSLEVGNEFYETGYFATVDPAFTRVYKGTCY